MGAGLRDAKLVFEVCRAEEFSFSAHTWTKSPGFLVNLHLYAAGPRDLPLDYPYGPTGWIPEARAGILREPIRVDADGTVAIPETPGLGIEIDEEKLARFSEEFFEILPGGSQ